MKDRGKQDKVGITGRYHVRPLKSAMQDCRKLCPRTKDRMEVRRHALKLRYWPNPMQGDKAGLLLDLNWEWIKAMPGAHVGELRINDVIGGNDNLRIIFFVSDLVPPVGSLPEIWLLAVMQKKRQDFSTGNLSVFGLRRRLVLERSQIK